MKKTAIALGTFDGLHIGHMSVIKAVLDSGFYPLALSFASPPKYEVCTHNLLMTAKDKKENLELLGAQPVFMDFDKVKGIEATDFLKQLVQKYNPAVFSFGFDFRFGKDALGNAETIISFCKANNIEYKMSPPVTALNQKVSSSVIREFVANGDMESANAMLGKYFCFKEQITKGDQRGRTIGFPTINQIYPKDLVIPKLGVYATITEIDGKKYRSVTNIGHRPTFKTENITAETYIFDFKDCAYSKAAKISLVSFIRKEEDFGSLDRLKEAIESDKIKAAEKLHSI